MGKEIDVKTYLKTIDDLVTVEDKLVTYRTLSKILKVHAEQAKELLSSYVNEAQKKSKDSELAVVYLVGGLVKDSVAAVSRFTLVPSDQLENEKLRFAQVNSEHVYSVCRGSQVSITDIYNAAKSVTDLEKEFSSIKCNDEDVQRITERKGVALPPPSTSCSKPDREENPDNSKRSAEKKMEPNLNVRTPEKKKTSPEKKKSTPKKKIASSAPKGGGITDMFKRQADKKKEEQKCVPEPSTKTLVPPETISDAAETREKPKKAEKPKKKMVSSKNKTKKLKRIRVLSDSESGSGSADEDEGKDEEKEDALRRMDVDQSTEQSDETIKIESDNDVNSQIPSNENKKGRKRIRKQVDKSLLDEEGYYCVEKEFVFESCSDEDDEGKSAAKSPKKERVSEPEKKSTPAVETSVPKRKEKMETVESKPKKGKNPTPQTSKQASITNFFKKV